MDVVELFAKGEPVMYLLLTCSVAVAAIGIERFGFYSCAALEREIFLSALMENFKTRQTDEILSFCNRENSCAGIVAAAGVKAAVAGKNVELALNIACDEAAMKNHYACRFGGIT